MKITKELLIDLIQQQLNERRIRKKKRVVRELDVIPGSTRKSKMIGENHKIVLTKRKNTTTNKITYIVALVKGTGKDEAITNLHKEFKKEEEANKFFEFIFQANIDLQTFNPNLKTPARYYIGEKKVFEGDLQLFPLLNTTL